MSRSPAIETADGPRRGDERSKPALPAAKYFLSSTIEGKIVIRVSELDYDGLGSSKVGGWVCCCGKRSKPLSLSDSQQSYDTPSLTVEPVLNVVAIEATVAGYPL